MMKPTAECQIKCLILNVSHAVSVSLPCFACVPEELKNVWRGSKHNRHYHYLGEKEKEK